jgi:NAD(P)-dependent dehydrogenase (short-subunit alcohol dehydrogenase family)
VIVASRRGTYGGAGERLAAGIDVCQPDQLMGLAEMASASGRLAAWVNAAATTGPVGDSDQAKLAQWPQTLAVNLVGSAAGCAAAARFGDAGAAILNISGGGATAPRPGVGAYAASKAAVVRHTETLAAEFSPAGMRVNALAPGAFASDLWTEQLRALEGPPSAATASEHVLDRAAACATWLLSDESRPLSGKLVAAQWDPWDTWCREDLIALQESDMLTLRRREPGPRS